MPGPEPQKAKPALVLRRKRPVEEEGEPLLNPDVPWRPEELKYIL